MPQSFACLHYHLIFSTRRREPWMQPVIQPRLYEYIGGIIRKLDGVLLAAGGMPDHVHLLGSLGRTTSISDAMRHIKAGSSAWMHESFADMRDFAWQTGYAAFATSYSDLGRVRRYIDAQPEHHRKMTFKEELIAFLERHQVQYDERYIWE